MKIYCDSSLKEACYVVEGEPPCFVPYIEPVTVNTGEYCALIHALKVGQEREFTEVELFSDSQLVVEQVNGNWKCQALHLRPLLRVAQELLQCYKMFQWTVSLNWIPREENLAGIALERKH